MMSGNYKSRQQFWGWCALRYGFARILGRLLHPQQRLTQPETNCNGLHVCRTDMVGEFCSRYPQEIVGDHTFCLLPDERQFEVAQRLSRFGCPQRCGSSCDRLDCHPAATKTPFLEAAQTYSSGFAIPTDTDCALVEGFLTIPLVSCFLGRACLQARHAAMCSGHTSHNHCG